MVGFRAFPKIFQIYLWYGQVPSVPSLSLMFSHNSADKCYTSLLFNNWFCPLCALEVCGACHAESPIFEGPPPKPCAGTHSKTWFCPISVFSVEELRGAIDAMESVMESDLHPHQGLFPGLQPIIPESSRLTAGSMLQMKKYKAKDLTHESFTRLWSSREPFVLANVSDPATPGELFGLDKYESQQCTTMFYDGAMWQVEGSTLGKYFKSWDEKQLLGRSLQIRVRSLISAQFAPLNCHE